MTRPATLMVSALAYFRLWEDAQAFHRGRRTCRPPAAAPVDYVRDITPHLNRASPMSIWT
jgi:hypothetical protein